VKKLVTLIILAGSALTISAAEKQQNAPSEIAGQDSRPTTEPDIKARKAVQEGTISTTLSAEDQRYELFKSMYPFLNEFSQEVAAIAKKHNLPTSSFSVDRHLNTTLDLQTELLVFRIYRAKPYALYTPWGEFILPFFSTTLSDYILFHETFVKKNLTLLLRGIIAPEGCDGSLVHYTSQKTDGDAISDAELKSKYMTKTSDLILHSSEEGNTFYVAALKSCHIKTDFPLAGSTAEKEYHNFETRYRLENLSI